MNDIAGKLKNKGLTLDDDERYSPAIEQIEINTNDADAWKYNSDALNALEEYDSKESIENFDKRIKKNKKMLIHGRIKVMP